MPGSSGADSVGGEARVCRRMGESDAKRIVGQTVDVARLEVEVVVAGTYLLRCLRTAEYALEGWVTLKRQQTSAKVKHGKLPTPFHFIIVPSPP